MRYMMIIMFILSSTMVLGATAGELTIVEHFDLCDSLRINVTGDFVIDSNEYELISCDETINNSWYCECYDDYDLVIDTELNTINNYTFEIRVNSSYEYSEIVKKRSSNSDSSNGETYYPPKVTQDITKFFIFENYREPFLLNGESHSMKILNLSLNKATLEFRSTPVILDITLHESKIIIINNTTLNITLKSIRKNSVEILIQEIVEKRPELIGNATGIINNTEWIEFITIENDTIEEPKDDIILLNNSALFNNVVDEPIVEEEQDYTYLIIGILALGFVLTMIGIWFYFRGKNGNN